MLLTPRISRFTVHTTVPVKWDTSSCAQINYMASELNTAVSKNVVSTIESLQEKIIQCEGWKGGIYWLLPLFFFSSGLKNETSFQLAFLNWQCRALWHCLYPWQQRRFQTLPSALALQEQQNVPSSLVTKELFLTERQFSICILIPMGSFMWMSPDAKNKRTHPLQAIISQHRSAQLWTSLSTQESHSSGK